MASFKKIGARTFRVLRLGIELIPFRHSATFRRNTEIEVEALMVENYCKGGSEYSGFLNFQNFDWRVNISENYDTKNGHLEPKSDKNQSNSKNSERQSNGNEIKHSRMGTK